MTSTNNISMLFLIIFSILTSCQQGEQSIIVVPENYTGYVLIIYGQEKGEDKEYQDKSRIYRIPENGVLLSKFPSNPGWSGFPKFYQSSISSENEIPYVIEIKDVPENKLSAFGGSTGFQSRDLTGQKGIRYIQYFIGNQSEIRLSIKELEKLDIAKLIDEE